MDGFRVDVAHGLAKNLAEPLASLPVRGDITDGSLPPGTHPLWDRDEVHDIYAEWRQVFNEYDPPRAGVAEAWVHPSRRPKYASPDGLGQAFNFDLLEANWNAGEFLRIITDNLSDAQRQGSSMTWVLSNHDVVRHATRYGLPPEEDRGHSNARNWLLSGGTSLRLERGLGLRRARAAILLMLALPGSAYLYQGEELGLHEVPDIPFELVQDPSYVRSQGAEKGRDGCRVPLPWTTGGPSFGFGSGAAHLPQPAWFGPVSVQAQERDPASTLMLYRDALQLAAQAADRGNHGMDARHQRPGAALRPSGRLALRDQLRARARPAAARHRHPHQRPGRGQPAARRHHRLADQQLARAPRQLVGAARVDHPVGRDPGLLRPHGAVRQPVQLARRVRVGVDGEQAAGLGGQPQ